MEGTPGAPGAEAGSDIGAEATESGAGTASTGLTETTTTAIDTAAAGDGGAEVVAEGAEATDDAARAADEADLQKYPEEVRERFRALSPEQRKEQYEFYEYAGQHVEARIKRERERNDKIEADRAAEAARRKQILARTGQHVGAEAQTLELPNGNTIELPSLVEMEELSKTQRGRDQLAEKYGLDEPNAEFWGFIFKRNREALDAAADLMEENAWGKLDANLRAGIQAELGLDPETLLADAKNPRDVVKGIVGHFQGQIAQLKREHEARIEAVNINAEAMRGRELAATSRELPTGGRTSAGGGEMTLETFRALPLEQRKQLRASNPALVDRLYALGAPRV